MELAGPNLATVLTSPGRSPLSRWQAMIPPTSTHVYHSRIANPCSDSDSIYSVLSVSSRVDLHLI